MPVLDVPEFRVGIQLADRRNLSSVGDWAETDGNIGLGAQRTGWAGDPNRKDPDGARIRLRVDDVNVLVGKNIDFRIGGEARDKGRRSGGIQWTPWASEGGGESSLITDHNEKDPDEYQLHVETRPKPRDSEQFNDFRLSIRAKDRGQWGYWTSTPFARDGGGDSDWAVDSNTFDPDGFQIGLRVRLWDV